MSYCRFADGDVYIVSHMGGLECCGCRLKGDFSSEVYWTRSKMLGHLQEHTYVGHTVPIHAVLRIIEERNRLGDDLEPDLSMLNKRE